MTTLELNDLAEAAQANSALVADLLSAVEPVLSFVVWSYHRRYLLPGHAVEDAMQEARICAVAKLRVYDKAKGGFRRMAVWAAREGAEIAISKNALIYLPRRRENTKSLTVAKERGDAVGKRLEDFGVAQIPCAPLDAAANARDTAPVPSQVAERAETAAEVRKAVARLPERLRQAVERFLSGDKAEGCTKQAEHQALHRAFAALRPVALRLA